MPQHCLTQTCRHRDTGVQTDTLTHRHRPGYSKALKQDCTQSEGIAGFVQQPHPVVLYCLQETRYRQRYLDGIVNHDHVRSIFETRARIVQYVRKYLDDRHFLEV